jgi:hypothetical protein
MATHKFKGDHPMTLETLDTWQTQARGTNSQEYEIYLACADDGKGGDITRNGEPLKTFEEWINSWMQLS